MSDLELTPPELREAAMVASSNLLPAKSRGRYVKAFKLHSDWASSKNAPHVTGNVLLAYFNELAAHKKPSTLWATYSMLKATINIKKNIDIAKYPKLQEFLKKENTGYKAKKSNVLTLAQVQEYLNRAPEDSLPIKSALIISISGACRSDDLFKMRLNDVEVSNERISVLILDTKPYTPRYFVVTKLEWVKILQRYINLRRNIDLGSNRFSLHHRSGKLTRKLLGHNSVAKILLANRGGDVMQLKRLGGWKSSAVAEGYVENSLEGQLQLANLLTAPSNKPIQKREATSTVVYSKAFSDPDPSSHSMSSLAQPQCTTSTCPTAAVTNTNVYNFTREDVKQGLHLTINSHDQSKVYINFNHMVSNPQVNTETKGDSI